MPRASHSDAASYRFTLDPQLVSVFVTAILQSPEFGVLRMLWHVLGGTPRSQQRIAPTSAMSEPSTHSIVSSGSSGG